MLARMWRRLCPNDAGRRMRHGLAAGTPGAVPDLVRRQEALHGRLPGPRRDVLRARAYICPSPIFRPGDGCCLPGATFYLDSGLSLRVRRRHRRQAGRDLRLRRRGRLPEAPETCQSNDNCTTYAVTGRADDCSAACVATPVTACVGGDRCCPPGCTAVDDSDCPPICGDGVVETSENCDRAITAGQPGACARTCDDGDACTFDLASGSVEGVLARVQPRAHHRLHPERRLLPATPAPPRTTATAPRNAATVGSAPARPAIRRAVARPPARTTAIRARPSS